MSCYKICWQFFVVEVPFCSTLKRTNTMDTIWMFIQSFSKAFMLSNNVEDRALLTSKFLLFNFDSAYAFIIWIWKTKKYIIICLHSPICVLLCDLMNFTTSPIIKNHANVTGLVQKRQYLLLLLSKLTILQYVLPIISML